MRGAYPVDGASSFSWYLSLMRFWPSALTRSFFLLAWLLISPVLALAQLGELDDLAARLAKQLKPFKSRLVAVVDFQSSDESSSPQGHYFAWVLSSYLEQRTRGKFAVANHIGFDKDLAALQIVPSALIPGPALQTAAPHLGADVLITGIIEKRGDSYLIQLMAFHVADGKSLNTASLSLRSSPFLESLITPFPPEILRLTGKALPTDVAVPSCLRCPDPSYNNLARSERIQGTCTLEVLISKTGEPEQIRPVKLLGYGLDEGAYNAVKGWKFRPAISKKDGTPVSVIVPIEVTFRLD